MAIVYWLALDGADARYLYDKHWHADGVERYMVHVEDGGREDRKSGARRVRRPPRRSDCR